MAGTRLETEPTGLGLALGLDKGGDSLFMEPALELGVLVRLVPG